MYSILGAGLVCLIHYNYRVKPYLDKQRQDIAGLRGVRLDSADAGEWGQGKNIGRPPTNIFVKGGNMRP